ncbi:hypothetical protein [Streptomyces malaysiensis]|uniref:hypothetical protein n=1 Tax=Streptomyces malaysiensis TaxID=92644 RepID=UPI001BE45898|nr:hypothetical protein [Streptomyces malaysiensis]
MASVTSGAANGTAPVATAMALQMAAITAACASSSGCSGPVRWDAWDIFMVEQSPAFS